MSKYDDVRKPVVVLKPNESTASYKQSSKNSIISEGREIVGRKSAFNGNEYGLNPEQALIKAQAKPRKAKQHKIDPFMVRQAKLKAKQQA